MNVINVESIDIRRLLSTERSKRGLTYEELAKGIGCSSSYIFRIEKGARKSPSFEIVAKIIKYFGLTNEELKKYQKGSELNSKEVLLLEIMDTIRMMDVDNFNEIVTLVERIKKYQNEK